jgi:hypothetical protein
MILTVAGVALVPQPAHADWTCIFHSTSACATEVAGGFIIDQLGAAIGNSIMGISAFFLTLVGLLLNVSIILTMNIKAIYQATPAIESVWIVVRNLSSIFIIFALIYTSIMTILDVGGQKLSALVKNIVIAGLLINFSLFFTKVAIDASNLISLQFFRAIAPNAQSTVLNSNDFTKITDKSFYDGGISAVFMQGLQIPKIYNQQTGKRVLQLDGGKNGTAFKILVSTILGSALMIIAGLSFLATAIAFIIRTVILLLLMGFSPVYFAGMVFPSIKKDISDRWFGWLKEQLIFMPVYLLFMYVAMSFISTINADATKSFFGLLGDSQNSATANTSLNGIILSNVGLLIQYGIALILILVPLIAAKEVGGGLSTKWGVAAKDWVRGTVGGVIGRNTAGRLGRRAGGAFDTMAAKAQTSPYGRAATSVLRGLGVSQAVRGKLSDIEKSKYGSKQSLEDIEKEDKDRSRVISGVQRNKAQLAAIGAYMSAHKTGVPPTLTQVDEFRKQIAGMDAKELEKIDVGTLTDPKFASHIPTNKYEALMKSDNLTLQQQQDLKQAREVGLQEVLTVNGAGYLINTHLKSKPQDVAKLPSAIITNPAVALLLDPAMLRKMVDENVSQADRNTIRAAITSAPAGAPNSSLARAQAYLTANYVF